MTRRPSVEQINQGYQQSGTQQYPGAMAPQTTQGMYPPQMAPQWQQPPPPVSNYMQPPQPYSQPSYSPAPVSGQYNNFATPQYQSYDQQSSHLRQHSMDYPAPPSGPPPPVPTAQTVPYPSNSQPMASFGQVDAYGRSMNAGVQSGPLLPHQAIPMQSQYSAGPAHSPLGPKQDSISPYQTQPPSVQGHEQQQNYYGASSVAPPKFQTAVQPTGATKRTYDASFDTSHMDQPLRHGARPPTSPMDNKYSYAVDGVDEDLHAPLDEAAMSYRRADGTERRRRLPSLLV
jgi:hypothetical protein